MQKEIRQLHDALVAQGFWTKRTKKGHTSVWKNGQFVTMLPGTPSDKAGFRNAVSQARKHGFVYKGH